MGKWYPYSTRWVKNIAVILHVFGALAIFLLFYDDQDTESESWEMEIGVVGPILNHKNKMKCSMGQLYPYSTKWGKTVVVILLIYEARDILYYFVITKRLNLSH